MADNSAVVMEQLDEAQRRLDAAKNYVRANRFVAGYQLINDTITVLEEAGLMCGNVTSVG